MRPAELSSLRLIRHAYAATYLQDFVAAGVVTVLVTRFYLITTGYPRIGSGGLHLAHVLWGGMCMMAATICAVVFIGPLARPLAAVLGGVGFGLFIDEVGKFITADNDYFYQPAAAIIYVVFVGLITLVRWLQGRQRPSHTQRVAAAIELTVSGAVAGLTAQRRAALIRMLDVVDGEHDAQDAEVTERVMRLVVALPDAHSNRVPLLRVLGHRGRQAATWLVTRRVMTPVAIALLYIKALLALALACALLFGAFRHTAGESVSALGTAVGGLVSGTLTIAGARELGRDRYTAFRFFNVAVLVGLMVIEVFLFAFTQFTAVVGVAVDLLLLGVVAFELRRLAARGAGNEPAATAGQAPPVPSQGAIPSRPAQPGKPGPTRPLPERRNTETWPR